MMKSIQVVAILVVLGVRISVMAQYGIEGNYDCKLPTFKYIQRDLCYYINDLYCGCRILDGIPRCVYGNCPESHYEKEFIKDRKVCDHDGKIYEETGFELAVRSCKTNASIPIGSIGNRCMHESAGVTRLDLCGYAYLMGCERCRIRDGVAKCIDETGMEYCPNNPGPPDGLGYCASNGKQYQSLSHMAIASCELNTPLKVSFLDSQCNRILNAERKRQAHETSLRRQCFECLLITRQLRLLAEIRVKVSASPCEHYCKYGSEHHINNEKESINGYRLFPDIYLEPEIGRPLITFDEIKLF